MKSSISDNRDSQTETLEKCNLCGSAQYKPYDSLENWNIVRCAQCGFCFTNPRPTQEALPAYYAFDYFKDDRHRAKFFNTDGSVKAIGSLGYDNRSADIETYTESRGTLLEVGAAMGGFLNAMKQRGWAVKGVEISQDAVDIAREQGIDIFCGTLEEFETEEKFDAVCMYQTLEHVADPSYVIERSHQLLKPSGILVIEVPNLDSFDLKINRQRKVLSYDLPRHLNHFRSGVLRNKLRKSGFEIVDIDLYYPNFIIGLYSLLQKFKPSAAPATAATPPAVAAPNGDSAKSPPHARKLKNSKTRLLKRIARHFPGWRFTIIARKIGP